MLRYLPVEWQERNLGTAQRHDWAYIDNDPVRDPDANLRLYDFLKEKNQRVSHIIIGANIHDNPQRQSGRRRSPLYWPARQLHRSTIK